MATPPSSGIGCRWTLRGPGRSTIPTRMARARTGTVRETDATKAIEKASRPAGMVPRSDLWRPRFRAASPAFASAKLAGLGIRRPGELEMVPHAAETRYFGNASRAIGKLRELEHRQFAGSLVLLSLGQHAIEDALNLGAILGCEVPVDRTLQAVSKSNFGLPAQQFLG